jgi:hypothetical protein
MNLEKRVKNAVSGNEKSGYTPQKACLVLGKGTWGPLTQALIPLITVLPTFADKLSAKHKNCKGT